MQCTGLPPAETGDYFRATTIYVDGELWGPDAVDQDPPQESLPGTEVSLSARRFSCIANELCVGGGRVSDVREFSLFMKNREFE